MIDSNQMSSNVIASSDFATHYSRLLFDPTYDSTARKQGAPKINQKYSPNLKFENNGDTVTYILPPQEDGIVYSSFQSDSLSKSEDIIYYYELEIEKTTSIRAKFSFGYKQNGDVRCSKFEVYFFILPFYKSFQQAKRKMPSFGEGSIVGCGYNYITDEVFFTKDGIYSGHSFSMVRGPQQFVSIVSLSSYGERVKVNFGASPFKFDLSFLVKEFKQTFQADLQKQKVEICDVYKIVQEYLFLNGYFQTLDQFTQDCKLETIHHLQKIQPTVLKPLINKIKGMLDIQAIIKALNGSKDSVINNQDGDSQLSSDPYEAEMSNKSFSFEDEEEDYDPQRLQNQIQDDLINSIEEKDQNELEIEEENEEELVGEEQKLKREQEIKINQKDLIDDLKEKTNLSSGNNKINELTQFQNQNGLVQNSSANQNKIDTCRRCKDILRCIQSFSLSFIQVAQKLLEEGKEKQLREFLQAEFPKFFEKNKNIEYTLKVREFIRMCQQQKIVESVEFAKNHLKGSDEFEVEVKDSSEQQTKVITKKDILSAFCYEDISESHLKLLLESFAENKLWEQINEAIIEHEGYTKQTNLSRLLQQLKLINFHMKDQDILQHTFIYHCNNIGLNVLLPK